MRAHCHDIPLFRIDLRIVLPPSTRPVENDATTKRRHTVHPRMHPAADIPDRNKAALICLPMLEYDNTAPP